MIGERRRATFGGSLAVALGWHLAVVGGLLALVALLVAAGVCIDPLGTCLGPAAAVATFTAAFAAPVGLALLVGTPLFAASLHRTAPSSAEAGAWSALASQVIAVALILVWVALSG